VSAANVVVAELIRRSFHKLDSMNKTERITPKQISRTLQRLLSPSSLLFLHPLSLPFPSHLAGLFPSS